MFSSIRKTLLTLGAFCALAVGGAALAGAASKSSTSSSSTSRPAAPNVLTGATADKVEAAALKKVPGATVLRVQSGGGAAYHAHLRKSDGTEVVVLVNEDFEATSVQTRPAGGRGGHRGGPGGPGGQTALTGDTAAKVKAAALKKVPGGTVLRTESGGHDGAAYHAHVRKSDGTEVVVLVDKDFEATSVQTRPARGRGGHRGGPGGPGGQRALTGDTAAKVKAAALKKVPGATVLRVESGGHGGAAYHAHVRKSDGSEVVVLVDKDFEATAVEERGRRP